MKKEFWDFDENINYITINIQGRNYKVINKFPDYYNAARILNHIHNIIVLISQYLQINYYSSKYSDNDRILIQCFCDIHPNNYELSEMQIETPFYGLNKPRNVHFTNKPNLGKDNNLRAANRHVFITLRNSNGNFDKFDKIMKLVIHEIAHTMCNHVRWRDDDHGKDFKHAEKIINDAYKKIKIF